MKWFFRWVHQVMSLLHKRRSYSETILAEKPIRYYRLDGSDTTREQ